MNLIVILAPLIAFTSVGRESKCLFSKTPTACYTAEFNKNRLEVRRLTDICLKRLKGPKLVRFNGQIKEYENGIATASRIKDSMERVIRQSEVSFDRVLEIRSNSCL